MNFPPQIPSSLRVLHRRRRRASGEIRTYEKTLAAHMPQREGLKRATYWRALKLWRARNVW
eukprot:3623342-Heterocapsa_arctica.AAC.1